MFIARYDPLREAMQQMRHQLFHQHFEQPYEETQGTGGGWSPLVDVFEDNDGIMLKVELPEVDANDVDIQIEGNALTLRGERKLENGDKQEGYHRVERSYGTFGRRFTLPSTVSPDGVSGSSYNSASAVSGGCDPGLRRTTAPGKYSDVAQIEPSGAGATA